MAPIGAKLCQNAFQAIPDVSFFEAGKTKKIANFEGPFTPRGWLRLTWDLAKTRFRWSPHFHFLTSKTEKISDFLVSISLSWPGHMCL